MIDPSHPRLTELREAYVAKLEALGRVRQALPADEAVRVLARLLEMEAETDYRRGVRALEARLRGAPKAAASDADLLRLMARRPRRKGWTLERWAVELQRIDAAAGRLDPGYLARRLGACCRLSSGDPTTSSRLPPRHAPNMDAEQLSEMSDEELDARARELRRELDPVESELLSRAWRRIGAEQPEEQRDAG